jgi:hypothetical protein
MSANVEYLERIAARIAQALGEVVPQGFEVLARDGEIAFGTRPISLWCGYPFSDNVVVNHAENPDQPLASIIEEVTRWILDAVQQDMTMELKVPWPVVADKPLGYFAAPMARIDGDMLRLWFDVDGRALVSVNVSLSES